MNLFLVCKVALMRGFVSYKGATFHIFYGYSIAGNMHNVNRNTESFIKINIKYFEKSIDKSFEKSYNIIKEKEGINMKTVNKMLFKAAITKADGIMYNVHDLLSGLDFNDPELFFRIYAIKKLVNDLVETVDELDKYNEEEE